MMCRAAIIAAVFIWAFPLAFSDTLINDQEAVAIGYGRVEGQKLRWTDCSRSTTATYSKPPYWVHKDDTCKLHPVSFGLTKEGDHYVVADQKTAAVFFPQAKVGDRIQLSRTSNGNSVLLSYAGEKLALAYKAQPTSPGRVENHFAHKELSGEMGGKEHTVTGCLSGPNDQGVYLLTNGRQKKGLEVGGNDELKNHVGHEVKLTGIWASASEIGEKKETMEVKGAKSEAREKHFRVGKIEHVSDTCRTAKDRMGETEKGSSWIPNPTSM